jgi:hypothetical protein
MRCIAKARFPDGSNESAAMKRFEGLEPTP